MNKALYVTKNKSFPILAKDIESRRDYLEKYVGKLHCPTPGCYAQLDYVELPYFENKKYSEHIREVNITHRAHIALYINLLMRPHFLLKHFHKQYQRNILNQF